MTATFARITKRLQAAPGLYFRNERAIRDGEAAFGICSAWAVDFLARAGRHDEACALFDRFVSCANDVGLFGEEIDPRSCEALGNFPQAYTHLGVVSAGLALTQAAQRGAA